MYVADRVVRMVASRRRRVRSGASREEVLMPRAWREERRGGRRERSGRSVVRMGTAMGMGSEREMVRRRERRGVTVRMRTDWRG